MEQQAELQGTTDNQILNAEELKVGEFEQVSPTLPGADGRLTTDSKLRTSMGGQFHLTEVMNDGAKTVPAPVLPQVTYVGKVGRLMYKIEDAEVPTTVDDYTIRLPSKVEFKRVILNIVNSMPKVKKEKTNDGDPFDIYEPGTEKTTKKLKSRDLYSTWMYFLDSEHNQKLAAGAFWYAFVKFLMKNRDQNLEKAIFDKMSLDYVEMLEWMAKDKNFAHIHETNIFLQYYFDILSQSVFYSYFYAFPKSRYKLDDDLKKKIFVEFSYLLTGLEFSNVNEYLKNWNLDLGAGNILKMNEGKKSTVAGISKANDSLPKIDMSKASRKRETQTLKYSPIMERYLKIKDYKTRNYLRPLKIKVSKIDQDEMDIMDERIKGYQDEVRKITLNQIKMKKKDKEFKDELNKQIKQIKLESQEHQRRLEKRKNEELEKGAHEYANYLVSMLNSGITNLMLGNAGSQ